VVSIKATKSNQSTDFLIENRFPVTLRILSPEKLDFVAFADTTCLKKDMCKHARRKGGQEI